MLDTTDRDGRAARGHREEPAASFTEAIDRRTGCIRARGCLDGRAADMLTGAVEALWRSGSGRVVLDLGGVHAVDDAGLDAIRTLQQQVAAQGGCLTLLDPPDMVG